MDCIMSIDSFHQVGANIAVRNSWYLWLFIKVSGWRDGFFLLNCLQLQFK